jgi:hypothetical protein
MGTKSRTMVTDNDACDNEREDREDREKHEYHIDSMKINWTVVVVQAIVQVIVLGGLLVGYIVTNERWKGGIDANMTNLTSINTQQSIINTQLRDAVEKLKDNIQILSSNQEKVVTLLEMHMNQLDGRVINTKTMPTKK